MCSIKDKTHFTKYRKERIKKECPVCSDLFHGFTEGVTYKTKELVVFKERNMQLAKMVDELSLEIEELENKLGAYQ